MITNKIVDMILFLFPIDKKALYILVIAFNSPIQ